MRNTLIVAAAALAFAAPAFAQASHEHGAAGAGTEHCAMHAAKHGAQGAVHGAQGAVHGAQGAEHAADPSHRFAPKMLLGHAAHLQLDAAQKTRLEALHAEHRQNCEQRMQDAAAAEAAAAAALAADTPDIAEYEAQLREAALHRVACKVDMARIGQQARAVLTPAQRQQLQHMSHGGH